MRRQIAQMNDETGGPAVFHVGEDLDFSNVAALERQLEASWPARAQTVVSFSGTGYIDAAVLGMLVRQLRAAQGRLSIVAPPEAPARRVIDLARLGSTLNVRDTL